MAEVVRMPKLSDTMTEGVVVEWHKKVGDKVESGDLLAEIETDKATMEFESFQEGVLLYIGVKKGQTAAVDAILAILGKKGEKIDKILKEEKKNGIPKPVEKEIVDSVVPQPPTAEPVATLAPQPTPGPASSSGDRVKASPMAKKLANEKGVRQYLRYPIGR